MPRYPIWKRESHRNTTSKVILAVLSIVLICLIVNQRHVWHGALRGIQQMNPNLDRLLTVLSVILTLVPIGIGIEMANNPPKSGKEKRNYRIGFIVIAGLLIAVTYWQGERNKAEQDAIRSKATEETKKIQTQYDNLFGHVTGIEQFVEHPPAGLTKAQVADVVRGQLTTALHASNAQPPALGSGNPPIVSTTPLSQSSQELKGRGLQLAKEIDDWIASVKKDEPILSTQFPQTQEQRNAMQAYSEQLTTEWNHKFYDRADSLVGELHVQGLILACRNETPSEIPALALQFRNTCARAIERAALELK
jgi:hypothetical protein